MMRAFLFLITLFLLSCSSNEDLVQVQNYGPIQGTTYQVSYVVNSGTTYQSQIDSVLQIVDRNLSTWLPHSGISKLNAGDSIIKVQYPLLANVIDSSRKYYYQTNSYFDITIEPLIELWGFYQKSSGIPDSSSIDSVLSLVGWQHLYDENGYLWLDKGAGIDVNGIAQGYSVDLIAEYLMAKGVENFMVEVGGELRAKGKNIDDKFWRIGIDKPVENIEVDRLQEIISLENSALATSGNYRKYKVDPVSGKKYGHSVNPKTGFPEESSLLSATVLSHSATRSDAWGTAMMVMGIEKTKQLLKSQKGLQAYWILTDRKGDWKVETTDEFQLLIN
jgi:FAD:protein FMN transferase